MFHTIITKRRDEWYQSSDCKIQGLIDYIENTGKMRDAQVDAIKTYLFLKIKCRNLPLHELFSSGIFNSINPDSIELTSSSRDKFETDKAAVALYEYATLKDRNGKMIAPTLKEHLRKDAAEIDCRSVFKDIFYGVTYPDYLFSLPMGAGKTYLMASFIYLDLYFALNEPDNPVFAHNFMILVPSGLKSSILPSLKHIQEFDPSWIIPEPTASQLKRMVCFEVLDEQKTANKSNRIKNPNAQKLNSYPLEDMMGLVAVTNAEKVILDRLDKDTSPHLFSEEERKKIECANELRTMIGKIPNLGIFIDEVHHAADGEIKLRKIVTEWAEKGKVNVVLGFSGTPYLDKAESTTIGKRFSIRNTDLSNVVYNYPLIKGVGNFLKDPEVKYSDESTEYIVNTGVCEFLDKFKETVYGDGTVAKLAIYCGNIETLEENIHPAVCEIAAKYGLDPAVTILKYHGGNKKYPHPEGSANAFASLDMPFSKTRIILLVQIGKEGWDCKSLTGVILPQKGACPTNMVLQTSCRCLRQTERGAHEKALIWLNRFNADILNKQLKQQQNISLQEFSECRESHSRLIHRYSRMGIRQVPPIDFYQLKVSYETTIVESSCDIETKLSSPTILQEVELKLVHEMDFTGKLTGSYTDNITETRRTTYISWCAMICKESFNTLQIQELRKYDRILKIIFNTITVSEGEETFFSSRYDQVKIRSNIRKAFVPRRECLIKEETIPTEAALLSIGKLTSPIEVSERAIYYPGQKDVEEIISWDNRKAFTPEMLAAIEILKSQGLPTENLTKDPHSERDNTYHYLPYHFDSGFERSFFESTIIPLFKNYKNIEVYFNGDETLTDFKIDCFKKNHNNWRFIGKYVPDFLAIRRDKSGNIYKVIIIETKGEGYAGNFIGKKEFMSTQFLKQNNEKFGYKRFEFLYLEDTVKSEDIQKLTIQTIEDFLEK